MAINHDLMAAGGRLVETKSYPEDQSYFIWMEPKEKRKKERERMEVLIHWTGGTRHSASLG